LQVVAVGVSQASDSKAPNKTVTPEQAVSKPRDLSSVFQGGLTRGLQDPWMFANRGPSVPIVDASQHLWMNC